MVFNRSLGNGKNQSSSSVRARARKICITSIASFGLFWPKLASVFPSRNFWFCRETLATIRDQSAMLGEHLSQKVMRDHAQNPKNWQKQGGGCPKMDQKNVCTILSKICEIKGAKHQWQKSHLRIQEPSNLYVAPQPTTVAHLFNTCTGCPKKSDFQNPFRKS